MGFIEQIEEAARRKRTGDDWYVTEQQYVLQIKTIANPLTTTDMFLVLPLAPEQYKVSRVFRQSIQPTLGGLVAEEQGLLWREINVTGSFGLLAKSKAAKTSGLALADTTTGPDGPFPLAFEKLSGPGWTRRMIRNIFERYGELKANPQTAHATELIWHDLKTGDSWVVVPITVDVDRNTARRMQYPWAFTLKAIAKADAIKLETTPASFLDKVRSAVAAVAKALDLVSSAIQEGSATLGEVRFFAAQIDSVLDRVTTIVNSASDFVQGVTDTLSIGAMFISSTAELMESTLALIEQVEELPNEVRQNYQQALDGLHAIGAQFSAFGSTYDAETAAVVRAEQGAAGDDADELARAAAAGPPRNVNEQATRRTQSTDEALVAAGAVDPARTRGVYAGTTQYAITAGDTLQSIAARFLGDGTRWWDIAVFNGLQAPYISAAGAPGTVGVGDVIAVPVEGPTANSAIAKPDDELAGLDKLGTDIALAETLASRPGRPAVDIQIDERTGKDFARISGLSNLTQALQLRLWTERGTHPLAPQYGLDTAIGARQTAAFVALLQLQVKQTVRQDSRVRTLRRIQVQAVQDALEFELDVVPIGTDTAQTITAAVV